MKRQIKNCTPLFLLAIVVSFVPVFVEAHTRRALIVGISLYPQTGNDAWGTIHGANDAELIVPVMKKQGFSITTICNKEATAKRIRRGLDNLVSSCKPGDTVYLHFSCHGQPYEDIDGDEDDGWDESIVPYDAPMVYQKGKYEGENHIIDDELHTYFQKLRSKVGRNGLVCVVIDACHAGGASRGEDSMEEGDGDEYIRGTKRGFSPRGKDFRPRINAKGHFNIPKETGLADILVLEACRSYQSNYEIKQSGKYYGPLSYYTGQVLSRQPLAKSTDWVLEIKKLMNADRRLARQNMVYETSLNVPTQQ